MRCRKAAPWVFTLATLHATGYRSCKGNYAWPGGSTTGNAGLKPRLETARLLAPKWLSCPVAYARG